MSLLEVRGLVCSAVSGGFLGFGKRRKRVLDNVNLTVEEGASVGLLGESGSGKSTLARCISGLTEPDSGIISFEETNIFPLSENRESIGLGIQMLFQGGGASLDPRMTVSGLLSEVITAAGGVNGSDGNGDKEERLVRSVGLKTTVLSRFPNELSGGEAQRVALARLLAVAPRLLILDEPTAGVDALNQAILLSLLKRLQSKYRFSILYITHDVPVATAFCDRVATLRGGNHRGAETEIKRLMVHEE